MQPLRPTAWPARRSAIAIATAIVLATALTLTLVGASATRAADAASIAGTRTNAELVVMTYNLRYASQSKPNAWLA